MSRPPISDSPWFWANLFATTALVGLALINPKFERRQAQVERQAQGRARAEQVKAGQDPSVRLSQPGETRWNLRPLYAFLAVISCVGWFFVWRQHLQAAPESDAPSSAAATTNR